MSIDQLLLEIIRSEHDIDLTKEQIEQLRYSSFFESRYFKEKARLDKKLATLRARHEELVKQFHHQLTSQKEEHRMSKYNFDRYRELYEKIGGLEIQLDALRNNYNRKIQLNPPITEKAAKKNESEYQTEYKRLDTLMSQLKKELDELIDSDLAAAPKTCVRPGCYVTCLETNSNDYTYKEIYYMSVGLACMEDANIQEMQAAIKLITPYDNIGCVLFGMSAGEEYSYETNGLTTKGCILKVGLN